MSDLLFLGKHAWILFLNQTARERQEYFVLKLLVDCFGCFDAKHPGLFRTQPTLEAQHTWLEEGSEQEDSDEEQRGGSAQK